MLPSIHSHTLKARVLPYGAKVCMMLKALQESQAIEPELMFIYKPLLYVQDSCDQQDSSHCLTHLTSAACSNTTSCAPQDSYMCHDDKAACKLLPETMMQPPCMRAQVFSASWRGEWSKSCPVAGPSTVTARGAMNPTNATV